MADNVEVKCIKKTNRTDPHERIHGIGGVNADGGRWICHLMTQLPGLKLANGNLYFSSVVNRFGLSSRLNNGHKYLKTRRTAFIRNNLLSLPECP